MTNPFYFISPPFLSADVKPIVSLDESPSDSNMDDNNSNYSNSFVAPILENSLAGISPGSQLPNGSSK